MKPEDLPRSVAEPRNPWDWKRLGNDGFRHICHIEPDENDDADDNEFDPAAGTGVH